MENNWQDKLRKDFEEYSESAPEGLWKGVEKGVSEQWNPRASHRLHRNRRIFLFSGLGAAAAVAILFFIFPPHEATTVQVVDSSTILAEEASKPNSEESTSQTNGAAQNLIAEQIASGNTSEEDAAAIGAIALGKDSASHKSIEGQSAEETAAVSGEEAASEEAADALFEGQSAVDSAAAVALPEAIDLTFAETLIAQNAASDRFSFAVSASNFSGLRLSSDGYGGLYGSDVARTMNSAEPEADAQYFTAVLVNNKEQKISTQTRHRQPVRFSLSASFRLNQRLALETGLNYSYLLSELSSGTDKSRYETRQTLHWLGIPLNLNYLAWNNNHIGLYVSAGLMAEKCIYGTTNTTYYNSGISKTGQNEPIMVKPLQWSLNAAAGLQYDLTPRLSLFLEPGVSYYIPNGTYVETIYTRQPWNWSIRLGLRYTLSTQ